MIELFGAMKGIMKNGLLQIRKFSAATLQMPPCDFVPNKYEGKPYADIREIRGKNLPPCLNTLYKDPLLIHQGHMQWLWDDKGRRYLDMFGGIVTVSVGHCHPKVVEETTKQLKTLWHTSNLYLHPTIHEYAEKLTSKMPGDLKVVYFVNSGSEANDLAMMMARLHTGHHELISLRNAYHGMSGHTMALTGQSTWKYNVAPVAGIHHAMNPDPFKGLWGGKACRDSEVQVDRQCDCNKNQCKASDMYYDQLEEVFKYSLPSGRVAGMFAESIQGVGGTVQFPHNYLKRAQELVHSKGGLYIADEVQTGFGRTGDHFWGFEAHGVTPDIVTMAKGIGNGFPLAAVVTTPRIAHCLTGALHFNTFGGNPLACAVGKTVLEIMEEEKLQARCKEVGSYLLRGLGALRGRWGVQDVRGKGLMLGVELSGAPLAVQVLEYARERGILLGKGGFQGNVLRIKPPMCITRADADFTLQVIQEALSSAASEAHKGTPPKSKEHVFVSGV